MKTEKSKFELVKEEWVSEFALANQSRGMQRLARKELTPEHYIGFMEQLYLQVRENASLQAHMALKLRGDQRKILKKFLGHAISEVGHEDLILDDLRTMGVDVERVKTQLPIPAVLNNVTFPFYAIHQMNPLVYLGHIFQLELMPTTSGGAYMNLLESIGVPRAAMTFIDEHSIVDIAHNKLMADYLEVLVQSQEDLDAVVYGAKVGTKLYFKMIDDCFDWVDAGKPSWGLSHEELAKTTSKIWEVAA
jgi:pyrroloquinoline quinone (PQQ) biosynthesis protein C